MSTPAWFCPLLYLTFFQIFGGSQVPPALGPIHMYPGIHPDQKLWHQLFINARPDFRFMCYPALPYLLSNILHWGQRLSMRTDSLFLVTNKITLIFSFFLIKIFQFALVLIIKTYSWIFKQEQWYPLLLFLFQFLWILSVHKIVD